MTDLLDSWSTIYFFSLFKKVCIFFNSKKMLTEKYEFFPDFRLIFFSKDYNSFSFLTDFTGSIELVPVDC